MYQQIIVIGHCGRDAEMQYTAQGIAVAKFNLACNKVTGKGDSRKEKTTWFRCTAWKELAEIVAKYVKKGGKVMVVGEVEVNAYTDKNGQPQASLELTAQTVKLLNDKREGDESQNNPDW